MKEYPTNETIVDGPPGMNGKGLGFNIRTGEVFVDEKMVRKFDLVSEAKGFFDMDESLNNSQNIDFSGNFYGVGVDLRKERLFFSFNGRVLNTLDFKTIGEIRFRDHDMRVQELIEDEDKLEFLDTLKAYTNQLDLDSKTNTRIKKLGNFKARWRDFLLPVIYIEKMCVVNWNIGALPFKIKDPMGSGVIGLIRHQFD